MNKWPFLFKSLSPSIQDNVKYLSYEKFLEQMISDNIYEENGCIIFDIYLNEDEFITIACEADHFYKEQYDDYLNYCTAPDMYNSRPDSYSDYIDNTDFSSDDIIEWTKDNLHKFNMV